MISSPASSVTWDQEYLKYLCAYYFKCMPGCISVYGVNRTEVRIHGTSIIDGCEPPGEF